MHKVYIVGDNHQVSSMFNKHPDYIVTTVLEDAAAVVYTGGADICPYLYGERPIMSESGHPLVRFDTNRDLEELAIYRKIDWSTPKIGICRGAQLLNVLAGGSMWQDINGHLGNHEIRVFDQNRSFKTYTVSSTHHQMMIPSADAAVLAVGTGSTIRKRQNNISQVAADAWMDSEIIYNWTNNSLCFQPHPEYGPSSCHDLFFELVSDTFFNKKKKGN